MSDDPSQLLRFAVHEAAHAVAAVRLGFRCSRVTVEADRQRCEFSFPRLAHAMGRLWRGRRITVALAGYAAIVLRFGPESDEVAKAEAGDDLEYAEKLIRAPWQDADAQLDAWTGWVRGFVGVTANQRAIELVAGELLARTTMPGSDVKSIVEAMGARRALTCP